LAWHIEGGSISYFGAERKSLLHVRFPFDYPFNRVIQICIERYPLCWNVAVQIVNSQSRGVMKPWLKKRPVPNVINACSAKAQSHILNTPYPPSCPSPQLSRTTTCPNVLGPLFAPGTPCPRTARLLQYLSSISSAANAYAAVGSNGKFATLCRAVWR
jgi:hypothetical protein